MSRLASTFRQLAAANRKGLIPFVSAGFPDPDTTVPLLHALVASGADIVELGIPFSDPMADGPTIQRASEHALRQGVTLRSSLEMVSRFRERDTVTPVVLMGYANPIEAMGYERFARTAAQAGVDGVLTVDHPPEARSDLTKELQARAIDPIFLLAPTSTAERIDQVKRVGRGYVYYVSLAGVTGASHLDIEAVAARVPQIQEVTGLPVAVGFGIRDAEAAGRIAGISDAVVIGSRIIEELARSPQSTAIERAASLLASFRQGIDSSCQHSL